MITPAAILYSLEKNNKIFPIAEAAAPNEIKIAEKLKQLFYLFQFHLNFFR